mmetsp:Transcript_10248/g.11352  ORF Transcript_10248/g.11352 Transcript_10248/m.11352 type:complete len:96 (-) Transcript_10248:227-514(-)
MAPITVKISKSAGGDLGVSFKIDGGCVLISSIKKGGIFHGTDLSEGLEIISINGEACNGLSIGDVEQLLASASGSISVIADDPMDTQRRQLSFKL